MAFIIYINVQRYSDHKYDAILVKFSWSTRSHRAIFFYLVKRVEFFSSDMQMVTKLISFLLRLVSGTNAVFVYKILVILIK